VTYYGDLQFYAPNVETAEYYLRCRETFREMPLEKEYLKIEPWFIEGEF
jgi:hypothetical protein